MARIRIGDFGNRVAPSVGPRAPTPHVPAEFPDLEAGGRAFLHEEQRRAAELRGAQRYAAVQGFQADLEDYTNGLTGQLAEGKVKLDELKDTFDKQLAQFKKERLDSLDPESQATLEPHFMPAERSARAKLRAVADVQIKQERLSTLNTAMEDMHRIGVNDPNTAITRANFLLDNEGPGVLGADKVAGQKQSFAERVWFSHYTDRMVRGRESLPTLKKLEGEIGENQVMDPDKRSILMGRVASMQDTLTARAQAAERAKLDIVRTQIERVDKMTLEGFEPTSAQLLQLTEAAKGTGYEDTVRAQVQFANQTASFRAAGPRAQEAYLTQLEATIRERPTPDAIKTLNAYRAIAKNEQDSVRNDPITFAGGKGLATVQPLNLTAALTDETSFSAQLNDRLTIGRGMRAQYGAPLKVFTAQETRALTEQLGTLTPQGKTQLFGALSRALGEDTEGYKAVMNQIRPDDPVTAIGGAYAANRYRAPAGQIAAGSSSSVSDLIFSGQQILHPKKKEDGTPDTGKLLPMPPEKDMRRDWDNYTRDAYAGNADARSAYFQTAQAIYAKLAVDAGDKDTSVLNSRRWDTAMALATGGLEDYRGKRTPMPWGMSLSDFKDGVRARSQYLAASGTLDPGWTEDKLRDLPLEPVGERRYVYRAGDGVVVNKAGQPVFVDFDVPTPLPFGAGRPSEAPRFPSMSQK